METVSHRRGITLMKWITVLTLVLAIGLNAAGVPRKITNPPLNTVAEVGGQAILTCTSDTTLQNWVFSKNREDYDTSTGQNIVINCIVQTGFTTHYDVDRPGGNNNSCNLIVKATTMQQAGVYTCTDTVPGTSAILTVIDRDVSITVSSQSETVEGDTVTMSYTVRYSTSTASSTTPTIQPVLTWTDSDGNTVAGSPSSTANSVTSNISVTAGRQDIRPYTCRISFEMNKTSPSSGLSFASNTPNSVSNPPTTSTINVLYAPIISSITKSPKVSVCPGKTVVKITCHAKANPAPTYSWIGPESRSYSGETITADMNGTYTCTASNVIRGATRSDMKEKTLNVLCWFWFLILLWLLNPISAGIFLILYKCSKVRDDYNERYLFLNKMLPCMNDSQETPCRKACWITLFIVIVIFSGIQFLILTIVTCAGCRNRQNRRVDGNGCDPNPRTNQRKCEKKSADETTMQNIGQNTQQTKQEQVRDTKNEQWKVGTRFQKICFALALAYMILGMILFAISVGVIYYECNRQCNKR